MTKSQYLKLSRGFARRYSMRSIPYARAAAISSEPEQSPSLRLKQSTQSESKSNMENSSSKSRTKNPYNLELKRRDLAAHDSVECFHCRRVLYDFHGGFEAAKKPHRFFKRSLCNWCDGIFLGMRAGQFPKDGQPLRRKIAHRVAHDYLIEWQMWAIWLEALNDKLATEIKIQRRLRT